MIDPGKLSQRVFIERQLIAADSFTERSWSLVAQVWASIQPIRPSEMWRADSMQAALSHTVLVRWQAALVAPTESAQWRVRYVDRMSLHEHILAISGPGRVLSDGGLWVIFDCLEGLSDGH